MSVSSEQPPIAPTPPVARSEESRPAAPVGSFGDFLFRALCSSAAALVIAVAVLLVLVLTWKSLLSIKTTGLHFFYSRVWDPEPGHRVFGALAFVFGTAATSLIAMIIAVPLGVGAAAFLAEIAPPWMRRVGAFLVEMLAAVPSVVYGFWGLFVLAPMMQDLFNALGGPNQGGVGILTASVVLAIMIVPYITSVSFEVCRAVPRSQREGAYALGASRWQMIRHAVLPYARPGIFGSCFLALGRALGETMAVTMLIGNQTAIRFSPFAMGNSIASVIANEFTEATYDLYLSALVELGLVLLLVSVIMNALARYLIYRVSRKQARKSLFSRLFKLPMPAAMRSADAASPPARSGKPTPARRLFVSVTDRIMTVVLGACLAFTAGILIVILGYITYHGVRALNWSFFVKLPAPVGRTGGGLANAIVGSAMLVGLATVIAVPIGLLAAVYVAEFRSERLGPAVRFVGELLGGVPSIVIGIFAYTVVVLPMGHFSGWAGSVALAVMMVPIILRAAEEALKIVPQSLRHASYALGASHWQTVVHVVIPTALPSIITAVFLAIARVAGETAPLLLTASSNQFWPRSPNDFMPSLPVYIFTYATGPYPDWHRQAWGAALVLLMVVMLLNCGVRIAARRKAVAGGRAE